MKNFILLLVVIMTTITISAQRVNRFGQKVVKEIHIAYVSKKGKILPQEEFFYDYDNELRLIGILRIKHTVEVDGYPSIGYVSDSIRLENGEIKRNSYTYDIRKGKRFHTNHYYKYTLNNDRNIVKAEILIKVYGNGGYFKNNHNFYYDNIPGYTSPQLTKYDWDELWSENGKDNWERQCWPNISIQDYGIGARAQRKIDMTPEETLDKKRKNIDYEMPYDLNIDISAYLSDAFSNRVSFQCESMTEWMPQRIKYFPTDKYGLNKYRPYVYEYDEAENIIKIKGYFLYHDEKEPRISLIIELKYW